MTIWTDIKYIRLISSSLERFKDIGHGVYQCRCRYCGDSERSDIKARGYFFEKKGRYIYMCHNCNKWIFLSEFIKDTSESLFQEYKIESFGRRRPPKTEIDTSVLKTATKFEPDVLQGCIPCSDPNCLPEVIDYVRFRKIPSRFHPFLYSVNNIDDITSKIPNYENTKFPIGKALVIPFWKPDATFGYLQFRMLTEGSVRYTTLDCSNGTDRKVWGTKWVDWNSTVYIQEGPIDAMCLPNCLALAGANFLDIVSYVRTKTQDIVMIFDNDYKTNSQIKKQLVRCIESNVSVVLFDKNFEWKDINDSIVKGGWSEEQVINYVKKRTFKGLRANLEFSTINRNPRRQHNASIR